MAVVIDALAKIMKREGCLIASAAAVLMAALLAGFEALLGLLVMWVWNTTSSIWHGPQLTFWQALAVWILVTLVSMVIRNLFGGRK